MKEKYYEFDPCSIDDSDTLGVSKAITKDENISIDAWKPRLKSNLIQKSEWRAAQNAREYHIEPGIDDIKKIKMHLKKRYPDLEIMDTFRINAETLVAIKNDKYDPITGISLDNQSKIYNKFDEIDKKLTNLVMALNYIANSFLGDWEPSNILELKNLIKGTAEKKPKKPKKAKKISDEE